MGEKDYSKAPELTNHYVSHALVNARFAMMEGDLDNVGKTRASLISKLERLEDDGSPYYELSRAYLEYLKKSGEWTNIEDVEEFYEESNKLESKILR